MNLASDAAKLLGIILLIKIGNERVYSCRKYYLYWGGRLIGENVINSKGDILSINP